VKDWKERYRELTGEDVDLCPACKQGRLRRVETLLPPTSHLIDRNRAVKGVATHDTS
jgi:hypothetical protein